MPVMDGFLPEVLLGAGHLDGDFCPGTWILPGHRHGWASGYGRVFPSKTLRNVLAFAWAFAQAYARANTRAKTKGGDTRKWA